MRMFPPCAGKAQAHTGPVAALAAARGLAGRLPRPALRPRGTGPRPWTPTYSRFTADVAAGMVPGGEHRPGRAGDRPASPRRGRSAADHPGRAGRQRPGRPAGRPPCPGQRPPLRSYASPGGRVLAGLLLPLLLIGGLLYLGCAVSAGTRQPRQPRRPDQPGQGPARVIDAERAAARFTDVAAIPRSRPRSARWSDYLAATPGPLSPCRGPSGLAGCSWPARPVPARPSLPARSPARPMSRSCPSRAPALSRCSSASARPGSVTSRSSRRRTRAPRSSSSSTRSTPSARPAATSHGGFPGSDEREQTLNQLLARGWIGFDDAGGVVVLAATQPA